MNTPYTDPHDNDSFGEPPALTPQTRAAGRTAAGDPNPCVTRLVGSHPDEKIRVSLPIKTEDSEGNSLSLTDFLCEVNRTVSTILPQHLGSVRIFVAPRFSEHEDDFGDYIADISAVYTRPLTPEERRTLDDQQAAAAAATKKRDLERIQQLCKKYGLHTIETATNKEPQ